MKRVIAFIYGVVCYLLFLFTVLYFMGFLGKMGVPKTIDSGSAAPFTRALFINIALITLFGLQHSVMARPSFKKWWTQIIPKPIERSTFVLVTSLTLLFIFSYWQPMPQVIWRVEGPFARVVSDGLFFFGWAIVLYSTFLINHFDLFGLRQVYLYFKNEPYTPHLFKMSSFYEYIRHPLMLGFVVVLWATPEMTVGHLLFAAGFTAYIFIGIRFEEKDLVRHHGNTYLDYRRRTSMILPIFRKK
jgi:methanethiol S-methyltransferase